MAKTVPLIRALGLRPFLDWTVGGGIPTAERLAECRLDGFPWNSIGAPVPLAPALRLLGAVASRDGVPDLGCRAAATGKSMALGFFRGAAGAASPRQAIANAVRRMPSLCTHLRCELAEGDTGAVLSARFEGSLDRLGSRIMQQHFAMAAKRMIEGGSRRSALLRIEIAPPPGIAVAELDTWFDCEVAVSHDEVLRVHFHPGALDRPIPPAPASPSERVDQLAWRPLSDLAALVDATRWMADGLLVDRRPTVAEVARNFGLSGRTFQRYLTHAGTSFAEVLDEVRRTRALRELQHDDMPLGQISAGLGYAGQSSLTRAVRRWTNIAPRQVRATRPKSLPAAYRHQV